jgi:hypothetical protein
LVLHQTSSHYSLLYMFRLPSSIVYNLLNEWFSYKSIVYIDSSMCNRETRIDFLHYLSNEKCVLQSPERFSDSLEHHIYQQKLFLYDEINCKKKLVKKVWQWFQKKGVLFNSVHLNGIYENIDVIVCRLGSRLRSLTIEVYQYKGDFKGSLSALNHCCILTTLNILRSADVTDAWLIVDINKTFLFKLECISFIECRNVSDRACVYLSKHCPLKSFTYKYDNNEEECRIALEECTAVCLLSAKGLQSLCLDVKVVTKYFLNAMINHSCLVYVDICIHIDEYKKHNKWNIDVSNFGNVIETCTMLKTFNISTSWRRVIFEYVKGQRVCLTNDLSKNCENASLISFFEKHKHFKSVCLRRFNSLHETVLDAIAKNIPDIVTLQLHQCGTSYGVSVMSRFVKCCPTAENFSFADCHSSLVGTNAFTESVHPKDNGHINVLFLSGGEKSYRLHCFAWDDFRIFPNLIEWGDDNEADFEESAHYLPQCLSKFNRMCNRHYLIG